MKKNDWSLDKNKNDAFTNEIKGNLFEYLVGHVLAQQCSIEKKFLNSLNPEMRNRFSEYENWLRINDIELLKKLPYLAQKTALRIISEFDLKSRSVKDLFVIGKSSDKKIEKHWKEADLVINIDDQYLPLSLKLCKANSYVNTKSAGILSFISNYFNTISESQEFQNELSSVVDETFLRMGHELYELAGLAFCGKFDEQWIQNGFSELPGEVSDEMNAVILKSYYENIKKIHEFFVKLEALDPLKFKKSILPLIGISLDQIQQVKCFHDGKGDFAEVVVLDKEKLLNSETVVEISPLKEKVSSFELILGEMLLQIRIKPMNRFTTKAFKINCSMKKQK